jgi:hypothetical protein
VSTQPLPGATIPQARLLGEVHSAGKLPRLPYTENAVRRSPSSEVNVTLMVRLAPTATTNGAPTDAVAATLLWVPPVPSPPMGPAFGGTTGGIGMVEPPPMPVAASVPLSLLRELDPQALKIGNDKTARSAIRWPSTIFSHHEPSVVRSERLEPATRFGSARKV